MWPQPGHAKPSGQRTDASHAAQASSSGNMRWKAIRLLGKRSMERLLISKQTKNILTSARRRRNIFYHRAVMYKRSALIATPGHGPEALDPIGESLLRTRSPAEWLNAGCLTCRTGPKAGVPTAAGGASIGLTARFSIPRRTVQEPASKSIARRFRRPAGRPDRARPDRGRDRINLYYTTYYIVLRPARTARPRARRASLRRLSRVSPTARSTRAARAESSAGGGRRSARGAALTGAAWT